MIKLTRVLIHSASSHRSGNGFNKKQLALLGITWPPKKGWLSELVGKQIDHETFLQFKSAGQKANRLPSQPLANINSSLPGVTSATKRLVICD